MLPDWDRSMRRCRMAIRPMTATGHSLPNCAARDMFVHHPIADNRADIAGRRFVPLATKLASPSRRVRSDLNVRHPASLIRWQLRVSITDINGF
jgi:hypothetical protein